MGNVRMEVTGIRLALIYFLVLIFLLFLFGCSKVIKKKEEEKLIDRSKMTKLETVNTVKTDQGTIITKETFEFETYPECDQDSTINTDEKAHSAGKPLSAKLPKKIKKGKYTKEVIEEKNSVENSKAEAKSAIKNDVVYTSSNKEKTTEGANWTTIGIVSVIIISILFFIAWLIRRSKNKAINKIV